MTKPIHATTPSGDAVTLADAELGARGRTVAQLEHNAMQALGLVRASTLALQGVAGLLNRANLLLSHSRGAVEVAVRGELKRVFGEVAEQVRTAAHGGQLLMRGGTVAFALDDPWQETSEPVCIDLPDFSDNALGSAGLSSVDLNSGANALTVIQRTSALLNAVRQALKQFANVAKRLSAVLLRLHQGRVTGAALPARNQDDGFVALIGRVRDHVLDSGSIALRVQGAPSTRAAWLVEASEKQL